jgi:hypothetical protein
MSGIVGKNLGRGSGIVTATPVGADTVSGASIVDDAIDSEHYVDGSIDNAHIADDAIDSEHYVDGSIDNAHVADNAIDSEHYAAGSIDLEHMSSESVDEDNLHISNSGSNGNFLSKQSGDTGGLTWAAASSDLSGDSSPQLGGFLDANGNYIQMQKGGDISSASPTVIDTDGDFFAVTGTTNFSAFTVAADRHFFLEFGGALTMTHGAGTLDLPGAANITTAASDVGEFFSTAANVVTCVNYTKRDGTAVVSGGGGTVGTECSTASGSADCEFTSIASGTKQITIIFDAVSCSITSSLRVTIGDSGGYETSGYVYLTQLLDANNTITANEGTSYWALYRNLEPDSMYGTVTLSLMDSTNNQWGVSGNWKLNATKMGNLGGTKSLSAELDRVKVEIGGGDDWDGGSINIVSFT